MLITKNTTISMILGAEIWFQDILQSNASNYKGPVQLGGVGGRQDVIQSD